MRHELNFFGKNAKFSHVGIAVKSIKAINLNGKKIIDKTQNVSVAFAKLNGLQIELIEPLNDRSPINRNLEKGCRLVHLCYEVPDMDEALSECRKYGFHSIAKSLPAEAFDQRKISWVYSKHFGLFELLESSKE